MRPQWAGVHPNSMTCVLIRKGDSGHKHVEGTQPCEDRSRDRSGRCDHKVRISKNAGGYRELQEAGGPSPTAWPGGNLDFRPLASATETGRYCGLKAPSLWSFVLEAPGS